mmetsp:Transcript_36216/g.86074  ORF Transcript_36216/g.86074 Transcript_36216/m.86074 type:complete len:229 (-) Transcript_36216:72-758(-)
MQMSSGRSTLSSSISVEGAIGLCFGAKNVQFLCSNDAHRRPLCPPRGLRLGAARPGGLRPRILQGPCGPGAPQRCHAPQGRWAHDQGAADRNHSAHRARRGARRRRARLPPKLDAGDQQAWPLQAHHRCELPGRDAPRHLHLGQDPREARAGACDGGPHHLRHRDHRRLQHLLRRQRERGRALLRDGGALQPHRQPLRPRDRRPPPLKWSAAHKWPPLSGAPVISGLL